MNFDKKHSSLNTKSTNELLQLINKDLIFAQAILLEDPQLSLQFEYDVLNYEWIKKYWKRILANSKSVITSDAATILALTKSVPELCTILNGTYHFSQESYITLVALAIIINRIALTETTNIETLNSDQEE